VPHGSTSSSPSVEESLAGSLLAVFGLGRKAPGREAVDEVPAPASTRPSARSLDEVRAAFWAAYSYLFPPHAMVSQNDGGSLVISWSMRGDPHAKHRYAAPVVLRFEPELLELMEVSGADHRQRIAKHHEPTLRAGLVGYDPYAGTQARIIVLG
jgi:hypothetical protein